MRSLKTLVLAVVLATCWTGRVTAQTEAALESLDRFQLFNECGPMELLVVLQEDEEIIELTKERLQTMVESRLRVARLFTSRTTPDAPFLYVAVHVSGQAFSLNLNYNKQVYDPKSGEISFAPTWNRVGTGMYGVRAADFILQAVSENLDGFVLEYLRVNEAACG